MTTPTARTLLRDLGLPHDHIEPVQSFSHAVWLTPEHAVRYHIVGPVGRLEHEAIPIGGSVLIWPATDLWHAT